MGIAVVVAQAVAKAAVIAVPDAAVVAVQAVVVIGPVARAASVVLARSRAVAATWPGLGESAGERVWSRRYGKASDNVYQECHRI